MRDAFTDRRWSGLYGEYWVLTELAKRKVAAQRLCERLSGCDLITKDNILIEVKTSQAHLARRDKGHWESRGWQFNSIRKTTTIHPDILVCIGLSDKVEFEVEHVWIMPTSILIGKNKYGYKNNFNIKDTAYQRSHSPKPLLVSEKWIEKYEGKWEIILDYEKYKL